LWICRSVVVEAPPPPADFAFCFSRQCRCAVSSLFPFPMECDFFSLGRSRVIAPLPQCAGVNTLFPPFYLTPKPLSVEFSHAFRFRAPLSPFQSSHLGRIDFFKTSDCFSFWSCTNIGDEASLNKSVAVPFLSSFSFPLPYFFLSLGGGDLGASSAPPDEKSAPSSFAASCFLLAFFCFPVKRIFHEER